MESISLKLRLRIFLFLDLDDIISCSEVSKSLRKVYLHMIEGEKGSIIETMVVKYSIITRDYNSDILGYCMIHEKIELAKKLISRNHTIPSFSNLVNLGFYKLCSTGNYCDFLYNISFTKLLEKSEIFFSIISNRRYDILHNLEDYTGYSDYNFIKEIMEIHQIDTEQFCVSAINHDREDLFLELLNNDENPDTLVLLSLDVAIEERNLKVTNYMVNLLKGEFLVKSKLICNLDLYEEVIGTKYCSDIFINLDYHCHSDCIDPFIKRYCKSAPISDVMILYKNCSSDHTERFDIVRILHENFDIEIPENVMEEIFEKSRWKAIDFYIYTGYKLTKERVSCYLDGKTTLVFLRILYDNFGDKELFKNIVMEKFWENEDKGVIEFILIKKYLTDEDCRKIVSEKRKTIMNKISKFGSKDTRNFKGEYFTEIKNRMKYTLTEQKYIWKKL